MNKEKDNKNNKVVAQNPEIKPIEKTKIRQIIIETDGSNIHLVKSESGRIELIGIFQNLIGYLNQQK